MGSRLETLTVAGLHVVVGSAAESGAPAISTGLASGPLPGLPTTGRCAALLTPATGLGQNPIISGALSVIDAGFECIECAGGHTAVATCRNLYLRRTTVQGLSSIAAVYSPHPAPKSTTPARKRGRAVVARGVRLRYQLLHPMDQHTTVSFGTDVHELSIPVRRFLP